MVHVAVVIGVVWWDLPTLLTAKNSTGRVERLAVWV
jgi:hypothetical protein